MIIGKAITAGGSGSNIKKVPLPEGYTQLTYIQSTGTQYIDTGYVPNQNTRIILDAHVVPTTSIDPVFGARTATDKNAFGLWLTAPDAVNPQYGNVSYGTQTINMDFDRRLVYELNKNIFTVDGITRTFAEATFSSTYPMYLFQINNFGKAFSRFTKGKIYFCKIYDNDVLVRDFVPCRNPDNVVGLYEMVNGVFYGNAGSGAFSGAPLSNVSGVSCFLTVETNGGALVRAVLGEKVFEAVADENGIAILILNKKGIWTVTATLDGMTITKEIDTSFSVEKNLSFFPAEPSSYEYMALITSSQIWTAPEDGYFQIEVFGASGNGGAYAYERNTSSTFYTGFGGGGGGGGYACSRVKLNKGDTVVITRSTTCEAVINSSLETYSTMSVTSGGNGGAGTASASNKTASGGTGGTGGTASGGNYANNAGSKGKTGQSWKGNYSKDVSYTVPSGGAAGYSGGNKGGNGGYQYFNSVAILVSKPTNGSAGFIKIYRGDTNVVA